MSSDSVLKVLIWSLRVLNAADGSAIGRGGSWLVTEVVAEIGAGAETKVEVVVVAVVVRGGLPGVEAMVE